VGGRGAGESHTELDRRKIRDRIAELQLEITAMELERKTQRARRQGARASPRWRWWATPTPASPR
jgi:GTP-binding protein HflX